MNLQIHNSLTGRREPLRPRVPGAIGMYVCGVTVYDDCHVGHARFLVVFDVVRRYLRQLGLRVTYVRNITDIDDKIIRRAAENGEPIDRLTARYIERMHEDCLRLGCEPPDHEPRATAHVGGIIAMIERLLARGLAYVAADGDVLYAVAKFPGYGRLSGKKLEDLRAGARIEIDEGKRDPLDFVLWKRAKPGEPSWPSPWGEGRPGWHIECSAMSQALLGEHFDIHGGGMDLKFPHHENEIAQSCGATGAPFVNLWMHNGFVTVDDVKMSKSLGNFFTLRDVWPRLRHPEVLRGFLLLSHYRGPINYSLVQLEQADAALTRLYTALRGLVPSAATTYGASTVATSRAADAAVPAAAREARARFSAAMDDDFNTPEAIAALQTLARELNGTRAAGHADEARALATELRSLGGMLGLLQQDPEEWLRRSSKVAAESPAGSGASGDGPATAELTDAAIDGRIAARLAARKARNFAEADRLRDELAAAGIVLEDQPGGVTLWRRS